MSNKSKNALVARGLTANAVRVASKRKISTQFHQQRLIRNEEDGMNMLHAQPPTQTLISQQYNVQQRKRNNGQIAKFKTMSVKCLRRGRRSILGPAFHVSLK